ESGNGGKLELRRVFAHEKPQELDECPTSGAHFSVSADEDIDCQSVIAGKPAPTLKTAFHYIN
ncbi:hypothetical protein, partial [Pseudomonas gelidaquae]|uniref:hypothetical protein n=1 Tax=Pseudomonas sp. IB20 TaxID=1702250 RepID=UPI001C4933BE